MTAGVRVYSRHAPQRRIALAATLVLACKAPGPAPGIDAGAAEPASMTTAATSSTASPSAPPAPSLAAGVTGFPSHDASLDLERCKKTSWSYVGCAVTYPVQGRAFEDWECTASTNPRDRQISCARAAEYRIRGVGGPVARSEGLATLRTLCATPDVRGRIDHATCYGLANELMWGDLAGARALMGSACDDEPDDSPVGCSTLRDALKSLRSFDVKVGAVSGLSGITAGDTCALGVVAKDDCQARVSCGDRILYNGSFPCKSDGGGIVGHEDMTSPTDYDAAATLDTRAGTLTLRDDAGVTTPAWSLKATLRERAPAHR